jgi:hypothetical protein
MPRCRTVLTLTVATHTNTRLPASSNRSCRFASGTAKIFFVRPNARSRRKPMASATTVSDEKKPSTYRAKTVEEALPRGSGMDLMWCRVGPQTSTRGRCPSTHQRSSRSVGCPGLYIIDGSAVSANPVVDPSLSITALTERAMGLVPDAVLKGARTAQNFYGTVFLHQAGAGGLVPCAIDMATWAWPCASFTVPTNGSATQTRRFHSS